MHGADDAALVLGDQESPFAGRHTIGHATPERDGLGPLKWMHETDRGAGIDGVDQEISQGVDLGVVDSAQAPDGRVGGIAQRRLQAPAR